MSTTIKQTKAYMLVKGIPYTYVTEGVLNTYANEGDSHTYITEGGSPYIC